MYYVSLLEDTFMDLIMEEDLRELEEYDRKQEQARFRAQMLAYAESFNYKFNKKNRGGK